MSAETLSPQALQLLAIRGDFETYAPQCLKIATKSGELLPFKLNRAQRYLHAKAEDQLARKGWVRLIIIKGRQQGISTYVGGRLYWKTSGEFGKRTRILTHLQEATDNLFGMVKTYHDNVPQALRPVTKNDNAKELFFAKLGSRYGVSTAGSRGTGRSATAQYFHGSEVAFWPNAEKHMAGIAQIIPLLEGTEMFLESTANGIGNLFHGMVMKAMRGDGDFELVFLPWYWDDGYQRSDIPADIEWEADELEYMDTFGLSFEQMYWRRRKIVDELNGDVDLFNQEYPATVEMAFLAGASKALISPLVAARAAGNRLKDDSLEALILGVDPAEYGSDSSSAVLRRGPKVLRTWRWNKRGNAELAGLIGRILLEYEAKQDPIDATCIDVTGVGTGVESILTDQGFKHIYRVQFGESALDELKYRNKGAECWGLMADWFKDKTRLVDIPTECEVDGVHKANDLVLQAEVSSRAYTYDARRRLVMQSKEEMARLGIPSPNMADGLALTFAVSVKARGGRKENRETLADKLRRLARTQAGGGSPGMAS